MACVGVGVLIFLCLQLTPIAAHWRANMEIYEIREGKRDQNLNVRQIFPSSRHHHSTESELSKLLQTYASSETAEHDYDKSDNNLDKMAKDLIEKLKAVNIGSPKAKKAKHVTFTVSDDTESETQDINKPKGKRIIINNDDIQKILAFNHKYKSKSAALRSPYNLPSDRTSPPRTKYVYSRESSR